MKMETLQNAEAWAVETFGGAELGDPRRTDRLVKVASALGENPSVSLPSTTVVSRKENRGCEVGNGRTVPKLDGSVAKETMQRDKELKEAWNSRYSRRVFESQEY